MSRAFIITYVKRTIVTVKDNSVMQKVIKFLFSLSLFIPFPQAVATNGQSVIENSAALTLNEQLHNKLVYLDEATCRAIIHLTSLVPDHAWSTSCKELCSDMQDGGNVAPYECVEGVVHECLALLNRQNNDQLRPLRDCLQAYKSSLASGKAYIQLSELDDAPEQPQTRSKKFKKICKLSVRCLFVNGVNFTVLQGIAGAVGASGPEGAQGIAGVIGAIGAVGLPGAQGIQGLVGAIGAVGPTGAQGVAGVIGAIGAAGPAGAQGIAGVIGAIGASGATGAPGSPGIPGVGGVLAYGYIYNLAAGTVAIEAPVLFSNNGPMSGVTHATGSSAIVVTNAGTYSIVFSVSGVEPSQFGLFINGAPSTSTIYGSGAGTQQNTGQAILTLAAGDTITLVNHSSAVAVTLQPLAGGTQTNVNASVLILRLV